MKVMLAMLLSLMALSSFASDNLGKGEGGTRVKKNIRKACRLKYGNTGRGGNVDGSGKMEGDESNNQGTRKR